VRSRILATILAAASLGLVAAGVVSYELQRFAMSRDIDTRLSSELAEARRLIAAQRDIGSADEALRRVLSISVPPEDGGTVGVVAGRPAYTSGVSEAVHPERLPGFSARVFAETADGSVRQGTFLHDGSAYRYIAIPVDVATDSQRGVFVVVIDQGRRLAPLDATFEVYALIALIALVVIGALGWLVAGRLLAPVRGLNQMAQRISADDLTERIPVQGNDDVSTLTGTVNSMLDRIGEGVEQRRALLDDVRHELKAPLSVIRGELELLVAGDPRIVDDARRIGIEEVDRMAALVDGLTDLTDVQTSRLHVERVDIGALTDDMLARCSALGGREWRISSRAEASCTIDRDRIVQAWLQLAQNADKYATPGSPVELGSSAIGDEVWMWVTDHGVPIPLEERDAIFDRFVRGRGSSDASGSGLGLSIVAAIADAHGGRVELEAEADGNTFSLVIPSHAAAAS
jgi:signal transduction histidine kinase